MGLFQSKGKANLEKTVTWHMHNIEEDYKKDAITEKVDNLETIINHLESVDLTTLQDPEKEKLKLKLTTAHTKLIRVLSRAEEPAYSEDTDKNTSENTSKVDDKEDKAAGEQEMNKEATNVEDISEKTSNVKNKTEESSEPRPDQTELDKISSIIQLNTNFKDKIEELKSLKAEINNTSSPDKLPNIVDACIIIEIFDHLRQVKKCIDRYKADIPQFPFPKNTKMYEKKEKEIRSLVEYFNVFPIENKFIYSLVQDTQKNIDEILQGLHRKAQRNEKILSSLKYLDTIKENIGETASRQVSESEKLKQFNVLRQEIKTVKSFNSDIVSKRKLEIICQLHAAENSCLVQFTDKEKDLKSVINKCEKDAHTFYHSISAEMYVQQRNDIVAILDNVKEASNDILSETINIILEILEDTAKSNKYRNDVIEKIKSFSETDQEMLLEIQKEEDVEEWDDAVILITELEVSIEVENAKLKLPPLFEDVKNINNDILKLDRPLTSETLLEKLSNLLFVQHNVDILSDENEEVNTQKNEVKTEISKGLQSLDEHILKVINSKKQSTCILDLEDQFKDLRKLNTEQDSLDFVQVVREIAEDFQEGASNYLGAKGSVDYYLIYENLVRLLEKLDTVNTRNDDTLKSTLEAMSYIQNLLNQLNRNTH